MNTRMITIEAKYEELFQYKKNIDEMMKLPEHSVTLNPQHLKIYLNDKDVKLQEILDCFIIEDEIEEENDLNF